MPAGSDSVVEMCPQLSLIAVIAGVPLICTLPRDLMFQPIYFRLWQDSYFSKDSGMVLFYLKLMSFLHRVAHSVLLDLGHLNFMVL